MLGLDLGRPLGLEPLIGCLLHRGGVGLDPAGRPGSGSRFGGLVSRLLAQATLVIEQPGDDVRVRLGGGLLLAGSAVGTVGSSTPGITGISGAPEPPPPSARARHAIQVGRNPQDPANPLVRRLQRREGGSGLFRIFGDGNHQSRHVREHAEQVRAYLEANLTQDLDMNAVARAASLSPFYLTRIFKQRFGVPPYRYLIGLRIRYASDLLRESSLSVTQVCHRSGFNSLSHFITTFRNHTGMSPSQYRRVVDWQQDAGRFGQETEPLVETPRRMNF